MTKILIVLFIAFSFEAIGVITLKRGINQISAKYTVRAATTTRWQNVIKLVGDWFTNAQVLLGLLLETIFFVLLNYLLAQGDVSFIWPLTALTFVMTTLAAKFILKENVDAIRWSGVALIILGAAFISYSEHNKPKQPPVETGTAAPAK